MSHLSCPRSVFSVFPELMFLSQVLVDLPAYIRRRSFWITKWGGGSIRKWGRENETLFQEYTNIWTSQSLRTMSTKSYQSLPCLSCRRRKYMTNMEDAKLSGRDVDCLDILSIMSLSWGSQQHPPESNNGWSAIFILRIHWRIHGTALLTSISARALRCSTDSMAMPFQKCVI